MGCDTGDMGFRPRAKKPYHLSYFQIMESGVECSSFPIWLLKSIHTELIMPPTSKKLREHIGFGFGLCIRPRIRSSKTVHARVLKFHLWISHGKIADTRFFSCLSYLPFWSYAPLKKTKWNLMHAISFKPCMLGFWNSYMDSSWKNSWPVFFFLVRVISLSGVMPLWKIRMKSCQQGILKTIWARGLKLGQLIGDDE